MVPRCKHGRQRITSKRKSIVRFESAGQRGCSCQWQSARGWQRQIHSRCGGRQVLSSNEPAEEEAGCQGNETSPVAQS